jgi:hypothetical protein
MIQEDHTPEEQLHALQEELGIQVSQLVPEEEILRQLSDKVELLLKKGHGVFFQLMYRLDIPEKSLSEVIDQPDSFRKIAKLIYDRQLQKIKSREGNRAGEKDADPSLQW